MFRHSKQNNVSYMALPPEDIREEVLDVAPSIDGTRCVQIAHYVTKSVSEKKHSMLDPRVVTVEKMLESGIRLNPAQVSNLLSDSPISRMNKVSQDYLAEKFGEVKEYVESLNK